MLIYFNFIQYLEGEKKPVYEKVSNYIKECAEGLLDVDYVKYRNNTPWNKMIRNQFVKDFKIEFEEIPIANDMFFSFQIGYLCRQYHVLNEYLYNYIVYVKSQTKRNWTNKKVQVFVENMEKYNGFSIYVNHKEWVHGLPFLLYQAIRLKSMTLFVKIPKYYITHSSELMSVRSKYPNILENKKLRMKP